MKTFLKKITGNKAFRYIFAGALTTFVNFFVFTLLCKVFLLDVNISNIISVILSILFAYVINKIYVFEAKTKNFKDLFFEFFKFISARGVTMLIEVGGVFVLYSLLKIDELISKLIINVIVLILNYIISKFLVFKK